MLSCGFTTTVGLDGLARGTSLDVGQMRVHIMDDGTFVT